MKTRPSKIILAVACLVVLIGSLALGFSRARLIFGKRGGATAGLNNARLVLWAWERPTDLGFIDRDKVSVAFLAKSITLTSNEVKVRPRLQSLKLPEGTKVIAVTRIETDREHKPALGPDQRERVARAITEMASLPNASEIQIDFDATQSERSFYRALLSNVRDRLPANTRLSMTALASWCMDDDWISALPVDEAVPMLFRMAGDGKQIANRLDAGEDFNEPLCRQSYGIALDERRPKLIPSRSLYVFNPDAWTEESVRGILESPK